jgi:hypothetical protein
MGRKVPKTLSLDIEIAEKLEEEENQSDTVEAALREYWGDVE